MSVGNTSRYKRFLNSKAQGNSEGRQTRSEHTLTHTRENFPLQCTQTKGLLTQNGQGFTPGYPEEIFLPEWGVRAHSILGSLPGRHPNPSGESPTTKPAAPRRTGPTGSPAGLLYTPVVRELAHSDKLEANTRSRQAKASPDHEAPSPEALS